MDTIATPHSSVLDYVGTSRDPQEVITLRRSNLDTLKEMGQVVIHKHRWNERDVAEGRAQHCPFHSDVYERGEYDEYCFGTGYLGGYSDGVLVPVIIADSQEDVFRPNEQGVLIHERHPGLSAPWTPEMGDTDMIIVVEIDPVQQTIIEMGDRYELREVTPVTMRGPGYRTTFNMKPFKVSQDAMIDLLPFGHPLYNVPINFNYHNVPVPLPPDYPVLPPGYQFNAYEIVARLVGEEALSGTITSQNYNVRLGVYPEFSDSRNVRLVGDLGGTHIHF